MADFMYIPNDDAQNYPLCILQLVVETFWTLNFMNQPIKIHKAVDPTNLGTCVLTAQCPLSSI